MNKTKLIIPFACLTLLVSCNKDMKKISDDEAVKVVESMLRRHEDPTMYLTPDNFVIKETVEVYEEEKTDQGVEKISEKGTKERRFDLGNLKYKEIVSGKVAGVIDTNYTTYKFYDKSKKLLITANDTNGIKTREEKSCTEEEAKITLYGLRDYTELPSLIKAEHIVNSSFESTLKKYAEQHEKYKDAKDEYYNYFVGSNDDKSLQLKLDTKLKTTIEEILTGYTILKSNSIITNDMLKYEKTETEMKVSSENNLIYEIVKGSSTTELSYDNAGFSLPNINDYTLLS